jgi:hypothetical protein
LASASADSIQADEGVDRRPQYKRKQTSRSKT